jgi:ABC-type Co2+ transport system permease subunit
MAKPMLLSLLYYLVVGVVVAYLVSRTLAPGTDYLTVFRVAGTVAWCAYFFAAVPDAIWFGKPWTSTAKLLVESIVYALLTGGVFGSLWPAA